MIGGDNDAVARLDPIFKTLAPGRATSSARRAARRSGGTAEARLPALRPVGRGPLREDGPQRDRVRHDAGVRGGLERHPQRERRQEDAREGRRDDAAARSAVLPIRHERRRHRRGLASRQRRRVVAARSHRASARGVARTSTTSPARSPTRAKAAGPCSRPSTRACRRTCCRRRSTRVSTRAGTTSSRTRFSPRCGRCSAVTTRRNERPKRKITLRPVPQVRREGARRRQGSKGDVDDVPERSHGRAREADRVTHSFAAKNHDVVDARGHVDRRVDALVVA